MTHHHHHVSHPVVHHAYSAPTYTYTPAAVSHSYVSQPVVSSYDSYVSQPVISTSSYVAQSVTSQPVSTQSVIQPATPPTVEVAAKAEKGEALLVLDVPEDAVVYLVGRKMKTKGTTRTYRIPLADASKDYTYPIRIEVVRDGETLVSETNKTIRADESVKVAVLETDEEGELVIAMK